MESDSKRLKKEEIEIIENEIIKRWFPFAKNYEEGISLLNALAVVNGGRLLAKILYKLSEETLDLACRVSAAISNVCIKFHMKKRFYAGSLYTFGFGASGRLGDGESDYHSVFVPKKINDIPKVAMVSCAEAHTSIDRKSVV